MNLSRDEVSRYCAKSELQLGTEVKGHIWKHFHSFLRLGLIDLTVMAFQGVQKKMKSVSK